MDSGKVFIFPKSEILSENEGIWVKSDLNYWVKNDPV